jgi:hypothetical protein
MAKKKAMTLIPDERTWLEKKLGVKQEKPRIPKSGPKGPTKISADKRTKSERLAGGVRAKAYRRAKEEKDEIAPAVFDWQERQDIKGYKRTANRAAAKAVAKMEAEDAAAVVRRQERKRKKLEHIYKGTK